MKSNLYILLIAFITLTGCATATDKDKWEKALKINTIDAYSKFIKNSSSSDYFSEANEKIDKLTYELDQIKSEISKIHSGSINLIQFSEKYYSKLQTFNKEVEIKYTSKHNFTEKNVYINNNIASIISVDDVFIKDKVSSQISIDEGSDYLIAKQTDNNGRLHLDFKEKMPNNVIKYKAYILIGYAGKGLCKMHFEANNEPSTHEQSIPILIHNSCVLDNNQNE